MFSLRRSLILLICISHGSYAQNKTPLLWERERFDENYHQHINNNQELPRWKKPFSQLPIIVGGAMRIQYQHGDLFQEEEVAYEELFLQRYNLHVDWYSSANTRFFVQLNYADDIKANDDPSPVDKNDLEFQQLLFQYHDSTSDLRIGKQEIVRNEQRLFGARDGTNVRRSHSAIWWQQHLENLKVTFLVGSPTDNNRGSWQDEIDDNEKYYSLGIEQDHWQANYLFYKDKAPFIGESSAYRNMLFFLVDSSWQTWKINQQAFLQWGHMDNKDILAWRYSGDFVKELSKNSEIILAIDVASGGESKKKLKAFDPMYMRGDLLSELSSFTASNLITLHPQLAFEFQPYWELVIESSIYWRYDDNNNVYNPGKRKVFSVDWSNKYIGSAVAIAVEAELNEQTEIELSYGRIFFDSNLTKLGVNHASEIELTISLAF